MGSKWLCSGLVLGALLLGALLALSCTRQPSPHPPEPPAPQPPPGAPSPSIPPPAPPPVSANPALDRTPVQLELSLGAWSAATTADDELLAAVWAQLRTLRPGFQGDQPPSVTGPAVLKGKATFADGSSASFVFLPLEVRAENEWYTGPGALEASNRLEAVCMGPGGLANLLSVASGGWLLAQDLPGLRVGLSAAGRAQLAAALEGTVLQRRDQSIAFIPYPDYALELEALGQPVRIGWLDRDFFVAQWAHTDAEFSQVNQRLWQAAAALLPAPTPRLGELSYPFLAEAVTVRGPAGEVPNRSFPELRVVVGLARSLVGAVPVAQAPPADAAPLWLTFRVRGSDVPVEVLTDHFRYAGVTYEKAGVRREMVSGLTQP